MAPVVLGRQAELEQLTAMLDVVVAGPRAGVVEGPAGVGKTTVVQGGLPGAPARVAGGAAGRPRPFVHGAGRPCRPDRSDPAICWPDRPARGRARGGAVLVVGPAQACLGGRAVGPA